ncbi:MAG TPA: amidohydrolase family protein, partial [Tepidisphaeraceae bacterium]|nr:amidohydrolase family protein [Tepidisphaeraceae bacterium]
DAAAVVAACPETQFVLDHCGGAVPKPFRREFDNDPAVLAQRDTWRRGIEGMAKHSNVACKISGVADAAMPGDATAEDVAPLVNFCLDQFGPDRVLFGGNWPVCLKGSTLRHWVESLKTVVAQRSAADQQKLFRENALRVYRVVK